MTDRDTLTAQFAAKMGWTWTNIDPITFETMDIHRLYQPYKDCEVEVLLPCDDSPLTEHLTFLGTVAEALFPYDRERREDWLMMVLRRRPRGTDLTVRGMREAIDVMTLRSAT